MAYRFINPQPVYSDGNGDPLNGGKLYFYSIGTSTLKDTYTTAALSVANTNPLVLDSSGRPTDEVWLNGDYRITLTDSTGATTYFDVDPYREPANATGVQNSSYTWGGTAGGSANALTISPTPVITAYTAGQEFEFIVASNNTSTATLNVNSVGAVAITKDGTTGLAADDLKAGMVVSVKYDGTRFQLLSPHNNVAALNDNQSFTKAQGSSRVALTDAATVAVDASLSNVFTVTLGGNRTLGQPTNPKDGQSITIFITQDGTGSRTLAYHADWLFPGGVDPTLTTTAAAVDVLTGVYNGATTKWYASLTKAYA